MKKQKILIVRPYVNHGGPIVLSTLCKYLIEKGYDAKLLYIHRGPKRDTNMYVFWAIYLKNIIKVFFASFLIKFFDSFNSRIINDLKEQYSDCVVGVKRKTFPFYNRKKTIVVYPEGIYGNFLHAKNVIRYFLNYYQFEGDLNAYSLDDVFICYRQFFNCASLNPQKLCVTFSYFNNQLYRQFNFGKRDGSCFFIRKGKDRLDLPNSFDGPIIDSLRESEKVEILNTKKYCYLYDTQTFYSYIAAVCGCIPIVVPEPGKTRADYVGENDISYGVAYGDDEEEIQYAISTREQLLNSLNFEQSNNKNLGIFIDIINTHFSHV